MIAAALALLLGVGVAAAQTGGKPQPAKPKPGGKGKRAPAPPAPTVTIDVPAVRKDLLSTDVERAAAAAQKLGQSRQPGALDAILDGLSMGLHPKVAAAALDALAAHRDARALDVLVHYARNRNPEVRAKAVTALGWLEGDKPRALVQDAFTDGEKEVRAAAIKVAETRKDKTAVKHLIALLKKGDDATPSALAAIGDANVAREVAELIGEAPDGLVAEALGKLALRTDLGTEMVYVEIIRAIGKIPGEEAVVALANYIAALGERSFRQSKREAQMLYEQRLGGGN